MNIKSVLKDKDKDNLDFWKMVAYGFELISIFITIAMLAFLLSLK